MSSFFFVTICDILKFNKQPKCNTKLSLVFYQLKRKKYENKDGSIPVTFKSTCIYRMQAQKDAHSMSNKRRNNQVAFSYEVITIFSKNKQ